jgi:NAD(P)-dependent dehydrogenase (short-subunit alcohol dehydrogenase family)
VSFEGKTALVTGAAKGIGLAVAQHLARDGARVVLIDRDREALTAAADTVEQIKTGAALPLPADVSDAAAIKAAVDTAVARFGGIDVLVNNAGYGTFGALEGATAEQVERQLRTNVFGAIALIRHVLPIMRAARAGTIVNVSSVGGRTAAPFASLYHASKFAIEGLSESLRYEASLHGIRVKLVEPAHFKTGFMSRSLVLTRHVAYDEHLDNYMGWVRKEDEKAPSPEPVAEAILAAAEDTSSRLRYPVHGAMILAMTRYLPDAFWRPLLAGGMTRRPK